MNRTNFMEVLEVLEQDKKIYDILKNCPYEILRSIRLKRYPEGKFILEQGEIHNTFYILVEGYADIFVESEQGRKYYISTYDKGRFIGELEMFEQKPYMSRIESRGPVTTLELGREKYLEWLECDQNFSQYVLRTLCRGTYLSMQKMGMNTLYSLKSRICQFLIENANEKGVLRRPLSAELLSERMAVTSRSVNRVLKELKDKGVLEISRTNVIIRDYQQLLREKDEN